jgi:hypothetical protein
MKCGGFAGGLTLRRDHLLLGEAQNGGAIALAGRPGGLEAIDRCLGSAKDSSRLVGFCEAPGGRIAKAESAS